eukprot:762026-Hanusia_phi.AAC.3
MIDLMNGLIGLRAILVESLCEESWDSAFKAWKFQLFARLPHSADRTAGAGAPGRGAARPGPGH